MQQAVAEARKFKTGATTQLARDDYHKHLEGVVFGDSPREACAVAQASITATSISPWISPRAGRSPNQPKAVVATAPDQAARLDFERRRYRVKSQPSA